MYFGDLRLAVGDCVSVSCAIDPKPGELALIRMKFREGGMEVRTGESFKILG